MRSIMGYLIVRFKPDGATPETDACHYDGFYFDRRAAEAIYESWKTTWPGWTVTLSEVEQIRFGRS